MRSVSEAAKVLSLPIKLAFALSGCTLEGMPYGEVSSGPYVAAGRGYPDPYNYGPDYGHYGPSWWLDRHHRDWHHRDRWHDAHASRRHEHGHNGHPGDHRQRHRRR
jgi:hypothetical protein